MTSFHLIFLIVIYFIFQVVFVCKSGILPFHQLQTRNMSFERRYSIYFETAEIMKEYDRLLEHLCHHCPPGKTKPFNNFTQLKEHVQRVHQLFYCELCVDHLKVCFRMYFMKPGCYFNIFLIRYSY